MESSENPIFDARESAHQIVEGGQSARGDDANEARTGELHNETLFDQDEDQAGEKTRLDTGEPIDNSTYTGLEHLSVIDEAATTDIEDDVAARWLRENDPLLKQDHKKKAA